MKLPQVFHMRTLAMMHSCKQNLKNTKAICKPAFDATVVYV